MPAKKVKKVKKASKPVAKPKAAPKTVKPVAKPAVAGKKLIGVVEHFFDKISVGVIELKAELKQGDKVSFEGPQTNFTQDIKSMQIEHESVKVAKKGQSVGVKTSKPVRKKDLVYKA